MPNEEMKMSIDEIKNAVLNPDLIKYLHGVSISNQWGAIDGRQLLLDVYRLCEKHEDLLKELND
ncbi:MULTISPECIES: hypothetical protein [Bacillus cereus group]|uniref:Uncharacterized protein n=3 Tax=Bacillus cereus group TaxID=86661 RepID=A1BZI4_BACCE|nr:MULTISPECIES: hypothetical protein [Bacillus cereus group]ABK00951.1 hypothetical protein pPER272_AH820_0155 [Bacillus cereus]ABK01215.1 hypothetical protein pPER272_0155 [Bacillus cereus]ACK92791.1 conserved hypothetical protein [Bacillus cereus AH820]MCU5059212.1 hypothetical protein [Bacillus cereus]MDK7541332.1 hypothetical protein [Bacillus paranthracis]